MCTNISPSLKCVVFASAVFVPDFADFAEEYCHNTIHFLLNAHNRYPIARRENEIYNIFYDSTVGMAYLSHCIQCFVVLVCVTMTYTNIIMLCIDFYVWDAVSIFNHLPMMFLSTDFAFRITDWTCYHGPHLHAILRIISRGVSSFATDSPCVVWGRGWTTCLPHDSLFFGSHFKMRVGM